VPPNRYYTGYGLEFGYVIGPPWTSIVAYDLNKGTIKWKVPFGQDQQAASEGAKDTGVFRGGERRGMVATSTGLLFAGAPDGKVRAYDQETGAVLWTATLPAASEGIPAMYQVNGRQYLVVSASTPFSSGRRMSGGGTPLPGDSTAPANGTKGYVAFALPERTAAAR
jgi:quinoprotein glucose dehydrogenase